MARLDVIQWYHIILKWQHNNKYFFCAFTLFDTHSLYISSSKETLPVLAVFPPCGKDPSTSSTTALLCQTQNPSVCSFIFQATKIHQRAFGNDHPITARSLELMATVYAEIGKTEYSGKRSPGMTDTVNTGQRKSTLLRHDIHQNSDSVILKNELLYLLSALESTQHGEDVD